VLALPSRMPTPPSRFLTIYAAARLHDVKLTVTDCLLAAR